jgi:hypothetical protein
MAVDFLDFLLCFIYLKARAKKANNPEIPVGPNKKALRKAWFL